MTAIQPDLRKKKRFERLTDAQLLTIISGVIFVLLFAIAVLSIEELKRPGITFTTILNSSCYLIILACALTVVMVGGGINISVGGVICLTCMACSKFLNESGIEDSPMLRWATFALAIGIGAVFGAFQGALISYLEIQPFIITLAGMFLARGLAMILSGGGNIKVDDASAFTKWMADAEIKIQALGYQREKIRGGKVVAVFDVPAVLKWASIIAVVVVIVIYLVMRYTKFGRNIYAIGGNQSSAKMLGINVKLTRFNSYLLSGALSGLAGFVFMMLNGAKGSSGTGLRTEMDAIASSIIGGTLLSGGVGNVIGSFFGTMILGTLQSIIGFSGLQEAYWQQMASGVMLGIFVVMQSIILSVRGKGKMSLPKLFHPGKKKSGGKPDPAVK